MGAVGVSIDYSRHVVVDVEATGPCPGLYSLIEIGAVSLTGEEFHVRMRPDTLWAQQSALDAIGWTLEEVRQWPERKPGVMEFERWLDKVGNGKRVIGWSDNPAFDWQFVNHALWNYCNRNPMGFSMRRIGDLWAGYRGKFLETQGWKRLRETPHTHDALDDAKGNAEALRIVARRVEGALA